jgi:subtilisin family serine protease
MDPALDEIWKEGRPDDIIEAVARLRSNASALPPYVKEISKFSDIRTLRLARKDIKRVWSDPRVASLKAPRILQIERPIVSRHSENQPQETAFINNTGYQGQGVVVGIVDWGFDFAHTAYIENGNSGPNGKSRIIALWDQRDRPLSGGSFRPEPYGYGRVFTKKQINRALRSAKPYAALGYHAADSDYGHGAHGTHVADIAAGTKRAGGLGGVAPKADLLFCHLASGPLSGLADLGDSVRILEALDWFRTMAGGRPLVINASIGRHGGSHTGLSLAERAFDAFVADRVGTQIVQSAGNYHQASTHASGTLAPGRHRVLTWQISRGDHTGNELEIWYSNKDKFLVELFPPGGGRPIVARLGETRSLHNASGAEIGRLYHRANDPNSPDHHIDKFLYKAAASGDWRVKISGEHVSDGRYHAWIERDSGGRRRQSKFASHDVDQKSTTGSICNGFLTIAVGAASVSGPFTRVAPFASSGPTRDGRTKPDVVAPGVKILAARSAKRSATAPEGMATRMSGASQSAPFVAGVTALCLQASGGTIGAHQLRQAIIGTANHKGLWDPIDKNRLGAGIVNLKAAVEMARNLASKPQAQPLGGSHLHKT